MQYFYVYKIQKVKMIPYESHQHFFTQVGHIDDMSVSFEA